MCERKYNRTTAGSDTVAIVTHARACRRLLHPQLLGDQRTMAELNEHVQLTVLQELTLEWQYSKSTARTRACTGCNGMPYLTNLTGATLHRSMSDLKSVQ
jgi:hypothetical protein